MSDTHSSSSSSNVFTAALALPPADRAALADALLDSLDGPMPADIETEWVKEIERRMAAYERDPSTAIPGEQVLAEIGKFVAE